MAPNQVPSLRGRATVITVISVVALIVLCLFLWAYRNTPPLSQLLGAGGNTVQEEPQEKDTVTYTSSKYKFAVQYPQTYTAEEYTYQALGPGKEIAGVKFTIPASMTDGTNLSSDSYISVEQIPNTKDCSASLFVDNPEITGLVTEHAVEYSFAKGGGAGAGNLYDETVYAISSSMPCTAVRYFIHSTQIANYPAGTRKEFDKNTLIAQFDAIRSRLILEQ